MSRQDLSNEKSVNTNKNSSSSTINIEQRYCICQKREDEGNDQEDNNDFMIECDSCNGWFHGRCIALADRIAGKEM
jgi:hypothetical protein